MNSYTVHVSIVSCIVGFVTCFMYMIVCNFVLTVSFYVLFLLCALYVLLELQVVLLILLQLVKVPQDGEMSLVLATSGETVQYPLIIITG